MYSYTLPYPVLSFLVQLQFGAQCSVSLYSYNLARYILNLLVTLQLSTLRFVLFCPAIYSI